VPSRAFGSLAWQPDGALVAAAFDVSYRPFVVRLRDGGHDTIAEGRRAAEAFYELRIRPDGKELVVTVRNEPIVFRWMPRSSC
jgi:hypothetical protein